MSCITPLKGWVGPQGKLVFTKAHSKTGVKMEVPCGQCWSCRLARSREWATRLVKEAYYWPEPQCTFITLTYNDKHLPKTGTLVLEHFQTFMKKLRYQESEIINKKRIFKPIKFFHCGEYGKTCKNCGKSKILHTEKHSCTEYIEGIGRAHYHAILFGVKFKDMEVFKKTKAGETIYKSENLTSLWGMGFCSIGKVTFESCAYVARYVMKKVNSANTNVIETEERGQKKREIIENHEQHYQTKYADPDTGEILTAQLKPEYITMSRNPAIGKQYALDNLEDIFKNDGVLISRKGKATLVKPPRYFNKLLEREKPEMYEQVKDSRRVKNRLKKDDNTPERNAIKQRIKQIKMSQVTRDYEEYHEDEN